MTLNIREEVLMEGIIVHEAQFSAGFGKENIFAVILLFLVLSSGCTFNHNLTVDLKLDGLPVTAKEPLTVGMYYSPEINTATYARLSGPHRYIFSVGKDSVTLFDRVSAMAFQNVMKLDSLPPFAANSPAVDMIIEPEIEAFHFRIGLESDAPEDSILYHLHFYTKEGIPLETRSVTGKQIPLKQHFTVSGQVDDNMEDAAGKVLQEFHHLPDMAAAPKALATQGAADSGLSVIAEPVRGPLRLTDDVSVPLAESGIIAVMVTVRNTSDRQLSVSEANMRLVLPEGRSIGRSGRASIPSRLEQRSYAGDIAAGLLGAPFGLLTMFAQSSAQNEKRSQLLNVLEGKGFGERLLGPAEKAQGIVFFMPAQGTPPFTAADLSLWVFDPGTGAARQVRLALSAIQFGSTTEKK
jgi:hypothetical protein